MTYTRKQWIAILTTWLLLVPLSYGWVNAEESKTATKSLWALLIIGQTLSTGNMIYQQEAGYYETNPIYGRHPSKARIYSTKIAETALIYGATKLYPKYEKHILGGANMICWGFMVNDRRKGIAFKLRF